MGQASSRGLSLTGGHQETVSSSLLAGRSAPDYGAVSKAVAAAPSFNRAWYFLHLIPIFAIVPQAWLTYHKLSTTKDGFLGNFNSDAAATSMAAFGVLSPVVFAEWSIFRFLRLLKLDSASVRDQLRPWMPLFLVPAAFVSMMFTTEAFQDDALVVAAKEAPFLMYLCMAMAACSSILTNTVNLFIKPDKSHRFKRLTDLEHLAFLAGNDDTVAADAQSHFTAQEGQALVSSLLEDPSPAVVPAVSSASLPRLIRQDTQAPTRSECFSSSKPAWVAFSFIAFFQFGLAGMKAYNCLSSGFQQDECTKAITLDTYLDLKHYGYGFAAFMGLESTIVNAYIWRRTCSDARVAYHYSNKSSIALAALMWAFSVVFTFAQISANKPLKSESLDNAIALAVPLFSAGLTFLSFLLLCNAARKLLPWTCSKLSETQQAVQSRFASLFDGIKKNPCCLDPAKPDGTVASMA